MQHREEPPDDRSAWDGSHLGPSTTDEEAATLSWAVAELRRRIHDTDSAPMPTEYVLFGVAKLLEALSRSLRVGHPPREDVIEAALEIAHHVRRHARD